MCIRDRPKPLLYILAFAGATLVGSLWALIPALLKAYLNVSEICVTILMNSVAIYLTSFFVSGPMSAGTAISQSKEVSIRLNQFLRPSRLNIGFFIAIAVFILLVFLVRRSNLGYRINMVGTNPRFADAMGINSKHTFIPVSYTHLDVYKRQEQNFIAAAAAGYDLVICSSSNLQPYLEKYAKDYPDVKFAIIDTNVDGDNVVSVSFAQNEGSFLAGAAAAMFTTKTDIPGVNPEKIIGWVGGMDIPVLSDFFIGYEQGAKHVDPDVTVLQSFAGVWTDPLKGKELTLGQYEQLSLIHI